MSLVYRIDPEPPLVRVVVSGAITVEDVREYRRALEEEPAFSAEHPRVIDLRAFDQPLDRRDLRRISDLTRLQEQGGAGGRRAIVVDRTELFEFLEMFVAYTSGSGSEYRVFRDMEEAERWALGE